ncbi:fibronectin type III domain-containing protein [Thiohalomonas denitrificans]|uniref:fibronectin type III domain-containing protein n=1 Tax=Thiohalomonas denitrificans TaxID=415747 RepID=UPI0026EA2039|nr:putative Ig domain-containing protein [Thiohalomonas denitrificans]
MAALLSAGLLVGTLQAAPPTSNTNWWDRHGDDATVEENSAPVIQGAPATEIEVGGTYLFMPTVTDTDGDRIKFSIANRPTWAGFDRKTGELSGTPVAGDVGTTADIIIQVSDGTDTASLAPFDLTVRTSTGGTDDGSVTESEPVNSAPEISGTPSTEVTENSEYRFIPTASDPDGDALSFSIANRPAWARFDGATGSLSGTPGSTDVGTTSGIVISVTDGALVTALDAFDLTVNDSSIANGSAAISWTPPTTRTDGSVLTDLAGYRLRYGQNSGDYSEMVEFGAGITSYVIEQLNQGRWYFTMTALDGNGLESEFSEEGQKRIE